uniref:Serine/threonine-protein kinase Nek4 n=1 Tax=Gouania willdenowi TaxID=441366 RepID=A0A8C5DK20_GOUWI
MVVGKGSYGEVNLVKHKTDRKQYVIKKLNLTTSSKRERRSAEQEAQLLSQLRHPNIVTYRESWEGEDCQLFIVMGFCEGGDLYHRLKQQKGELLPEKQIIEWFVQIAMALQYLHERNILHRDLKTQNIFLTKANIIKVGDLGIARVLENQNDMASTLIGTPYYMSPELFSNKPYNHKSDVWALGCCVYEMSTLKHAFNAKDMNSLVYRIVEGKLPQMPSRYDPLLGDLIKSMLCKRPENRPDVKLILRQPYIKRQIAMFLEATKEKSAKSRRKAVGGSVDAKTCNAPCVLTPEPELLSRKDEKLQEPKSCNEETDCAVQSGPPPKPHSPDPLKSSITSMATVSNIDIQMQQEDKLQKKQVQKPQSVVSHHQGANEPVTHSVSKDSKERWKSDPSPCPPPKQPCLGPVSGVCCKGGDQSTASNGLLDIQPRDTPNPIDTFIVTGNNLKSDTEEKDDTMDLLKKVSEPSLETFIEVVDLDVDNNNDTVSLLKQIPEQHQCFPHIQSHFESTENLLEPSMGAPVQEEPPMQINELHLALAFPTPLSLSTEPSSSQQYRGKLRQTPGDQDKLKVPRPLPQPPAESALVEEKKKNKRSTDKKTAGVTAPSVISSQDEFLHLQPDRPLSARERRRLRQSQDSSNQSDVNVVRRASCDVTSSKTKYHHSPVRRSASDLFTESNIKDKTQKSDENSSTSSTERSDGDCRERMTESSDMHDLVDMMTQTLKMDVGDWVEFDKSSLPEFKLHRKYRDTLVLHGKVRGDSENLSLGEIPTKGSPSGPGKIRRAIEHLRTDVVKGLGVKLLDRVLEIMEEEDESKRELCLRDQMGDDKYQAYAVMVRQLKFFEDIAFRM